MKLRFQSHSIRFRLKRGEVAQLAKARRVEESIVTGGGKEDAFQYRLEAAANVDAVKVELKARSLVVQIPLETVCRWSEGSDVGIEATLPVSGSAQLHVLIEKDFACLHGPSEDNVDTFPHPLAEAGADPSTRA